MDQFTTVHQFELPKGYVDADGNVQKQGEIRLATAGDEILSLNDPRCIENPAYHNIILISRVITKLGTLPSVNPKIIENLFASDFRYLQSIYQRINSSGISKTSVQCPKCETNFDVEPNSSDG